MSKIEVDQVDPQSSTNLTIGTSGDTIKTGTGTSLVVQGDGSSANGIVTLNCSQNSHGVKLSSPDHSGGQSYTMKLPATNITAGKFLKVDSITGSGATAVGQLSFADEPGGGKVKQFVYNEITSTGSTTTQIPFDDSIPQNTEGAEVITQAITPTSSSSKLIITLNASFSQQNYSGYVWALFQDSNANALKSWYRDRNGDSASFVVDNGTFQYIMSAGTTSATTFKLRFGPSGSYTAYWGTDRGSGLGGGTFEKQSLSIMEVE